MEDNQIVELLWNRNEKALESLRQKYGGLCFYVANNILNDRWEAEECVNDTYMAAWKSIPPERPDKLSAFLARITRNNAVSRFRRSNSKKRGGSEIDLLLSELDEDIPSTEKADGNIGGRVVSDIINDYLKSVPKSKAAIFIHRYFLCFSIEEISARTGRTYNSVATLLHRMRKELKQRLNKEGIEI